ncbi:SDR family NAD(P)-dependent oxidoreductase [Nocardia sp. CA2R105]|uniref:SDR family NAD(P)-dependent oxidoreductase n=1 Tax=Nocardia coffeae TaxID=2873381 RepID=UPI001CA6D7CA|nr:SDR family NAD(P)-dependent oxidoreductase [Nocardia coffeae]MBY8862354.1 SDR family NAD(P)-dependent oxidoreductase [Nocardia coffeae]
MSTSASTLARRYGPWAIIAGASEGVGASLADQLGAAGVNLVLIARNAALLQQIAEGVRDRHGVQVRELPLDLTADPVIGRTIAESTAGLEVGLVIYNAGAASHPVPLLEQPYEYWHNQVRLNCIGPLSMVYEFAPAMRDRGRGGIVVVGSLACIVGAPTVAVYSAEKIFQVNFAESMWAELQPHGVDVACAILGYTDTPANRRRGIEFDSRTMISSETAAREIIANLDAGPVFIVGEQNRAVNEKWLDRRRRSRDMMSAGFREDAQRVASPGARS